MCTTVGETAADYLNDNLGFGLTKTTYVAGALLVALLVAQFRPAPLRPRRLLVGRGRDLSVFGTLITDNMTDRYNVPLTTSTPIFAVDPGDRLRAWWCRRAHAVDPHDLHHPARGLLLAGDPLHVRARHRGRRPLGREVRPRLRRLDRDLRRRDRAGHLRPLRVQAQRRARVLARLHPDPAARRLDRRLHVAEQQEVRRPRPRARPARATSSSAASSRSSSSSRSPGATPPRSAGSRLPTRPGSRLPTRPDVPLRVVPPRHRAVGRRSRRLLDQG